MAIKFACPKCNKVLSASDDKAGRQFRCPTCAQPMTVPGATRASSPAPAAEDDDAPEDTPMKACPFCSEKIQADARKCKHCGEILDPVLRKAKEGRRREGNTNVAVGGTAVSTTVVVPEAPREFPHLIHAVITLFFCGAWLPVWILHYILWSSGKNTGWVLPVVIGAPVAVSCLGIGGCMAIRAMIPPPPPPPHIEVKDNKFNFNGGNEQSGPGTAPAPTGKASSGDTKKAGEKPLPSIDPNKVIDTIQFAGVTWKATECVREASGITVLIMATSEKTTRRFVAGATLWDDSKDGPHESRGWGGDLPEGVEAPVRLTFPDVTRKAQKIDVMKLAVNFEAAGEFRNLAITDKSELSTPPHTVKPVLGTLLGRGQISEEVEIEVGEQKVKWSLSLVGAGNPNAKEETITLPKAGTYKYKIKATAIMAGDKATYTGTGEGFVEVKDGSKIFYSRSDLDPKKKTYTGALGPVK